MAKCICGHADTKHLSKRSQLPAYCSACRAKDAAHEFKVGAKP